MAYRVLRHEKGLPESRLDAAGYLGDEHKGYLAGIERQMTEWGLGSEFRYHGAVDRAQKIDFLRSLDVLSVPGPYPDPKGTYLLEAMAAGTPVVQPRRGAYVETIERTGGGLLVEPTTDALADGLLTLARQPDLARTLGRRGAGGVGEHYSVAREAERVLEVYGHVVGTWERGNVGTWERGNVGT